MTEPVSFKEWVLTLPVEEREAEIKNFRKIQLDWIRGEASEIEYSAKSLLLEAVKGIEGGYFDKFSYVPEKLGKIERALKAIRYRLELYDNLD